MSDRNELEELRRLDELERKAGGQQSDPPAKQPETKWYDDLNAGIASGATRIARGVLKPFVPEADWQQMEQQGGALSQQSLKALQGMSDTPLGKVGDAGMDVVSTAALPFGAASKVPALTKAMQARGFLPAVARTTDAAATQAGIGAALSPDDRLGGAAWGVGGGVVGQVLGRALGGIVRPTNEAQVLLDKGVALTPGQAAGKSSLINNLEQKATSIPLAGHLVESARNRGLNEANLAAVRSVADLVDKQVKLGHTPSEAIAQTRDAISKHYDTALGGMSADPISVRNSLTSSLDGIVEDNPMMTENGLKQLSSYVDARLTNIANKGYVLDGPMLKQLDSEIGSQIRRLKSSTNAEDKVNAGAWLDLQQSLREIMAGAAKTEAQADALTQANNAYRQLLVLEKSLLPGADSFTPRRLQASLEKAQGLSGTELARVSNAMNATLPNTVPDSGTTARLLANALPLFTGGIGYGALGMPLAGVLLGTRTGAKAMTGSLPGQQALANALRRVTPATLRSMNNGNE